MAVVKPEKKVHYCHALLSHLTLVMLSEQGQDETIPDDTTFEAITEDEVYRILNLKKGPKL